MNDKTEFADKFNTNAEWFEFYGDVSEDIPTDAPPAYGKAVEITAWVDADHAGNKLTRHSHTGILIFLMLVPIFFLVLKEASYDQIVYVRL